MNKLVLAGFWGSVGLFLCSNNTHTHENECPNILLVVLDDMGYLSAN